MEFAPARKASAWVAASSSIRPAEDADAALFARLGLKPMENRA